MSGGDYPVYSIIGTVCTEVNYVKTYSFPAYREFQISIGLVCTEIKNNQTYLSPEYRGINIIIESVCTKIRNFQTYLSPEYVGIQIIIGSVCTEIKNNQTYSIYLVSIGGFRLLLGQCVQKSKMFSSYLSGEYRGISSLVRCRRFFHPAQFQPAKSRYL